MFIDDILAIYRLSVADVVVKSYSHKSFFSNCNHVSCHFIYGYMASDIIMVKDDLTREEIATATWATISD